MRGLVVQHGFAVTGIRNILIEINEMKIRLWGLIEGGTVALKWT
jgi:hypothetical protein